MIATTLWFFLPAAVAGGALAAFHLRGRMPPWKLTVVHGLLAASGLGLLIIAVADHSKLGWGHAIVFVFVAVASGGLLVLSFHLRGRRPPRVLIVGHALGAATAVVLLLLYVLKIIPPSV